jgi:ElaB/YqjD/DUF883 family membrane-anchored ribosome-binding protein
VRVAQGLPRIDSADGFTRRANDCPAALSNACDASYEGIAAGDRAAAVNTGRQVRHNPLQAVGIAGSTGFLPGVLTARQVSRDR